MPLEMKYFVLKPKAKAANDPHSRASQQAMKSYAAYIERYDPDLAIELRFWAGQEENRQNTMEKIVGNHH